MRGVVLGLVALGLVLGLVAPGASAGRAGVREDRLDANYLIGALTWTAGAGGIAWDPAAPSEDLGGPANPEQRVRDKAGQAHYKHTGDRSLLTVDRFASAPFPADLFLNASRLVQLDLNLTYNYCNTYDWDVEVLVDSKLLGGHRTNRFITHQQWPASKCVISVRLQPELDFIPKGARVEIVVTRTADTGIDDYAFAPRYVTSGPFRSVIRIPFFPAEETVLRIPHLKSGAVSSLEDVSEKPSSDTSSAAALAALGGAGLVLAAPRRRTRGALVLAVLVASALAGCMGGQGGPTGSTMTPGTALGGSANSTFVPAPGGSIGEGVLAGTVADDLRIPVGGAHVSLLGSPHSARTDAQGRFRLENVTQGSYGVRVDAEGFRPFEGDVEVRSGQVTVLAIELVPFIEREQRPHRHDYWGEARRVLFLETQVPIPAGNAANACDCLVDLKLPDAATDGSALIRPGTYAVEVVLDWEPGTTNQLRSAGVGFQPNNELGNRAPSGAITTYNETRMETRARQQPTMIRTAWEMTDIGHQTFSTWRFFVYTDERGPPTLAQGVFNVKIFLHKGVVPLEPAHRDFWAGAKELALLTKAATKVTCATQCTFPDAKWGWTPASLVPPGTAELLLLLEQSEASQPTAFEWTIAYKPANVAPPVKGDFTKYKTLAPERKEALRKEFRILLAPEEADAFYSQRSNWHFVLDDGQSGAVAMTNEVTFSLSITAKKGDDAKGLLAALVS